jgi:cytochrome c biogenesis protein CcmG/thiol:disulfide interchange protein DsbE
LKSGVLKQIINLLFFCLIGFFVVKKIPVLYDHFQKEGSPAPRIQLPKLDGNIFDSDTVASGLVLVFWATWCPPCEIELNRINELVLKQEIAPEAVIAISLQEDPALVKKVVKERNYRFQVAATSDATLANLYKVAGTPTIVFIDQAKTIRWMTTGLSPTLEFRIKNFLKN